jgi:RNA polymerase sigma-70 factor (sigma-E family)
MDFEAYVAARGQALLRFGYVLTGDAHLAEDLTQTALAQTYRHWRRVSRLDHPDAYVRKAMLNAHLSWRRRRSSTERPTAEVEPGIAQDASAAVADRDEMRRLLDTLPPRARSILVLRYYADLDDPSIAALLGISASTVRATASRAIAALRPAPDTSDTATTDPTQIGGPR